MAHIIPKQLNEDILNNPRKQGEIKVYEYCKSKLGNDWTVFYNVSWIGKVFTSGHIRDGETDFIMANPAYGIVVAEVKGGQVIEYQGDFDQWYSTNKNGLKFPIKNAY